MKFFDVKIDLKRQRRRSRRFSYNYTPRIGKHLLVSRTVHEDPVHVVSIGVFLTARCCDTCKTLYFLFYEDGALAMKRVGILYVMIFGSFTYLSLLQ